MILQSDTNVIEDAKLTLTNKAASGKPLTTVSNAASDFIFDNLPSGDYVLTVEAAGLSSVTKEINSIKSGAREMETINSGIESNRSVFTSPAFTLKNVRQMKENQTILDNLNLEIAAEKLTALVGPSGAGKTSLLRLLNRLDDPTGGEIFYRSELLDQIPVQHLRRRVGFVFQTPVMFPGSVGDNLRKALEIAGKAASDSDFDELIKDALALVELDSALTERDGTRLSGGQKQRVNIARALINQPEVLLMDEPTSALDAETSDKLMQTVGRLIEQRKITVVMVTHRLSEARRFGDRTVVMEAGKIIETGATVDVFERSANQRVRAFLEGGQ